MKKKDYELMLESALSELKFYRLQTDALCNSLSEIGTINEDNIVNRVIENTIERYNLDKLIHAKKIFNLK